MRLHNPSGPFDRSGLALVSDLDQPDWRSELAVLETKQARFLEKEVEFRSAEYSWPMDPLHTWSRVWEYPYTYHHLRQFAQEHRGRSLRAVDLGSGVTFMPFAVADLGYEVICVDTDPIPGRDLPRAAKAMGYEDRQVTFRQTDGTVLPFEDHSIDCLYCVSVLEHIPQPARVVGEIARILKPQGLLVLTIDLALQGSVEIGPHEYARLIEALDQHFALARPMSATHPSLVLTSKRGPYPLGSKSSPVRRLARRAYYAASQAVGLANEPVIACEGFVLSRSKQAA